MAQAQIGPVIIWGDVPESETPDSTPHIMVSAGGTIATGGGHTLGIIASTRRLSGWGRNSWCQLGFCPTSPEPETPRINPPNGLDEIPLLSISAGLLHSIAIRDGDSSNKHKVIGWGFNGDGQAAVPTNLKAKVVSAGETTSAAIDLEGNLVAWGALSNTGATGLKFHTVAMGNTFGIALQTDGTLFAWGSDSLGQPVYKANVTHASEVFVYVYAGDSHWIAVRPTGEVICEGYNEDGQNSVPSGTFHSVSTGDWHCFAWRTPMNTGSGGELEVWGRNDEGQGQLPSSGGPYSVAEGGWLHNAAIEGPRVCYANCDGSRVLPILDANDFACFSARFVAGDPYANCDGNTTPPLLTVNDYICFANQFACGCEYSDNRSHPCPPEDP